MLRILTTQKAVKTAKKLQQHEIEFVCLKARKALMKPAEYKEKLAKLELERTRTALKMISLAKKLGYDLNEFV